MFGSNSQRIGSPNRRGGEHNKDLQKGFQNAFIENQSTPKTKINRKPNFDSDKPKFIIPIELKLISYQFNFGSHKLESRISTK